MPNTVTAKGTIYVLLPASDSDESFFASGPEDQYENDPIVFLRRKDAFRHAAELNAKAGSVLKDDDTSDFWTVRRIECRMTW